jgi:TrmH family RNA methyltransferase
MRLLTLARDLKRRKAREREALFVVEGIRIVEELIRSPIEVVGILSAPKLADTERGAALLATLRDRGISVAEVGEKEFRSAAETESPQGVLAIARIPARSLDALAGMDPLRLVVLDAVQDPGNVGTIIRTAAALGANATIALPGTVDVWNAKVVRSAMGSTFHHLTFPTTWNTLAAFLRAEQVPLWAAESGAEPLPVNAPSRLALALGNEGGGLTSEVRREAERLVSVPISPEVESLNVAVAAGILLHELRP